MFKFKTRKMTEIEELQSEIQNLRFQLEIQTRNTYEVRLELAKERMNREKVIEFLEKNCTHRTNEDGSTTITLHSFIPKMSLLFVTRKELGVDHTWGI